MGHDLTKIFSIAYGTFIEALRSRLLPGLLFVGGLLILVSVSLPALHPEDRLRLLMNVQLSALSLLASLMMIFFIAPALSREIEERTLYPMLSKPVGRAVYLQGRLLGGLLVALLGIFALSLFGLLFLNTNAPVARDRADRAHPMRFFSGDAGGPVFDGEGLYILSHFPKEKLWLNTRGNHTARWHFSDLKDLPNDLEDLEIVLEMDKLNISTQAKVAKVRIEVIGTDDKLLFSEETFLEEKGLTRLALDLKMLAGRDQAAVVLRPLDAVYYISVDPASVRLGYRGGGGLWMNYFRAALGAFFAAAMVTVVSLAASTYFSQKMAIALGLFTYAAGNALPYLRSFARLLGRGSGEALMTIPQIEAAQANAALLREDLPLREWMQWLHSPLEFFCNLFPDFQRFDFTGPLMEGVYIDSALIAQASLYLLVYCVPIFFVAVAAFQFRELK